MESFEAFLKHSTSGENRTLPGCAVVAVDKNGIIYSHSSGMQSLNPESPLANKPFTIDTTAWIASCTKLLTSISALQCVEKGLLTLDGNIADVLPECKDLKILAGWEDEDGEKDKKPVYKPLEKFVTLRQLLSHSSGFGYAGFDPKLKKEFEYQGKDVDMTDNLHRDILKGPLLFEPGTSWQYGTGIDVAGALIERVTGGTLGDYFKANFFDPLGMPSSSFRLTPEIAAARADMSLRPPGSEQLMPSPTRFFKDDLKVDAGGAGLFSCARDYSQVLSALLKTPSPLLKPESLDILFTPQLGDASRETLFQTLFAKYPGNEEGLIGNMFHGGTLPMNTRVSYSCAGIIATEGVPGARGSNAVAWGGLPNLIWCVDRDKGRAIMYASQLLPPGDAKSGAAFAVFEKAVFGGKLKL